MITFLPLVAGNDDFDRKQSLKHPKYIFSVASSRKINKENIYYKYDKIRKEKLKSSLFL